MSILHSLKTLHPTKEAIANNTALIKKGIDEPAKAYTKPIIKGPGIFPILVTDPAIPNILPCWLIEILLDRKAGIEVLIIPKPAASKAFVK